MRRVEVLLGVIILLLVFQLYERHKERANKTTDRLWTGYAFNKERKQYELWFSTFASRQECMELMTKEINHELAPGHWLRGANFGDWYTKPGCLYRGDSAVWTWVVNTFTGAHHF